MLDRDVKIQERAYELWKAKGQPHGADWNDWLEAEKVVDTELMKTFAPKKPAAKPVAKAKKPVKAG